jgi:hypothetical protein
MKNKNPAFIYHSSSPIEEKKLREVLEKLAAQNYIYFFKWPHKLNHDVVIPAKLSPEGQLVTTNTELRWKKKGEGYQALLLSNQEHQPTGFQTLAGNYIGAKGDELSGAENS